MQAYDNTLLVSIVSTLNATIPAIAEEWDEYEDAGVVYRMVDYSDKRFFFERFVCTNNFL